MDAHLFRTSLRQAVERALIALVNVMADLEIKLSRLEKRAMSENMKPNELVRQFQSALDTFDTEGDPIGSMNHIRLFALDYVRSLSSRYGRMTPNEKVMLCRVCLFEAAMRLSQEIQDDTERQQKYDLVIALCLEIENHQAFIDENNRLFIPEDMRRAALREGVYLQLSIHLAQA